ncbi:MAG: hypothetical protein COA78_15035 [Blastopirellula sp.]|nr:MAG: hypothetical protein COA78_15035 [Blastopirellula sp.]
MAKQNDTAAAETQPNKASKKGVTKKVTLKKAKAPSKMANDSSRNAKSISRNTETEKRGTSKVPQRTSGGSPTMTSQSSHDVPPHNVQQPAIAAEEQLQANDKASLQLENKSPPKHSSAKQVEELLDAVNAASSQARNMWLGFLGLFSYLCVAIAGVSHVDLLLNNLVKLPIVDVEIPLSSFFIAAPVLFVLVHLGLLVQHALLSKKIHDFLHILDDGIIWGPGPDKIRGRVHSYAQTQLICGPERSRVLGLFLHIMTWTTLYGLPVLLLLSFQIRFLPYHDEWVTFGHAVTLSIEILCIFLIGLFIARPSASFFRSFADNIKTKPLLSFFVALFCPIAIYLSVFVLTVPDSHMDNYRQQQPAGLSWIFNPADWLTKTIFVANHPPKAGNSGPSWKLDRNLVVIDVDVVPDKDDAYEEISHRIRNRDLRYALLDRSDLHRVDFSNSDLTGVSAVGTRFEKSKFGLSTLIRADLQDAVMKGATFYFAQMQGANLKGAQMQGAVLQRAEMEGAVFKFARMQGVDFSYARMQEATFYKTQMQGANFVSAQMQGANFSEAQMQATNFSNTKMQGADFSEAQMKATNFSNTKMQGANFSDAHMHLINFNGAQIWQIEPPHEYQINPGNVGDIDIRPAKPGELRIMLARIDDEAVRRRVEVRIAFLLEPDKVVAWGSSLERRDWEKKVLRLPDVSLPAAPSIYPNAAPSIFPNSPVRRSWVDISSKASQRTLNGVLYFQAKNLRLEHFWQKTPVQL